MPVITGSYLRKIREENHIPLEQVASATRIRLSILQDLEVDDYSELSSITQARGFLRVYAAYLGVEEESTPSAKPATTPPAQAQTQTPAEVSEEQAPLEVPSTPATAKTQIPKSALTAKKRVPRTKPTRPAPTPAIDLNAEPQPPSNSQLILQVIGRELVARRRYLRLDLEEASERTHIPKNQIAALERGDLSFFSNAMQARGMLQSYGEFLNLETRNLLSQFADALQEARIKPVVKGGSGSRPSAQALSPFLLSLRRFFTLDLFFGTILVLGILFFLIWGIARLTQSTSEAQSAETIPAVLDVLMSTPSLSANGVLFEATATEPAAEVTYPTATPFYTPQYSDAALEVIILARQNSWLRVSVDDEQVYQGRLEAGNVMSFVGEEAINLETGNLAGLEIIFNQEAVDANAQSFGIPAWLVFDLNGVTIQKGVGAGIPSGETTPTMTPRPTTTQN